MFEHDLTVVLRILKIATNKNILMLLILSLNRLIQDTFENYVN